MRRGSASTSSLRSCVGTAGSGTGVDREDTDFGIGDGEGDADADKLLRLLRRAERSVSNVEV